MRALVVAGLLAAASAVHAADVAGEVRAFEDAFAKACNAGDVAAAKALYADDARLVWPGAAEEAKGAAEIEKVLVRGCKDVKDLKLEMRSLDVIPLDDTHVATVGRWDDSFTTPAGRHVSAQVRTTEVLVKQDGAWKYLVDHASVGLPAGPARRPEERRPLLRRRG